MLVIVGLDKWTFDRSIKTTEPIPRRPGRKHRCRFLVEDRRGLAPNAFAGAAEPGTCFTVSGLAALLADPPRTCPEPDRIAGAPATGAAGPSPTIGLPLARHNLRTMGVPAR